MRQTILFFDLDGTLMVNPFRAVVFPAVLQKLHELTGASPDELRAKLIAESDRRIANPPAVNPSSVWDHDDIMMTVAAAYRIPDGALSPRLHEELCAAHAAPPHTATLDDAASVLRSLKTAPDGRPRRLVVSTMGLSKYQLPVMRALGLYELFDDVLTPDLTDHLKTARGYYARYLDAAGTYASARRINIGDNYEHDIEVPKSLGALAVLRLPEPELAAFTPFERAAHLAAYSATIQNYPTDRPVRAVPDAVVISLAELPAVIAHLEAVDQA